MTKEIKELMKQQRDEYRERVNATVTDPAVDPQVKLRLVESFYGLETNLNGLKTHLYHDLLHKFYMSRQYNRLARENLRESFNEIKRVRGIVFDLFTQMNSHLDPKEFEEKFTQFKQQNKLLIGKFKEHESEVMYNLEKNA